MTTRTVYLAIRGCYSERFPCGIYPTPEAAIADLHEEGWVWERRMYHYTGDRGYGGQQSWANDQDWDSAISINAYEYDDEAVNERSPDRIIATWDASSTRLAHVEINAATADLITRSSASDVRAMLEAAQGISQPNA